LPKGFVKDMYALFAEMDAAKRDAIAVRLIITPGQAHDVTCAETNFPISLKPPSISRTPGKVAILLNRSW
jgi:hypothetical protein